MQELIIIAGPNGAGKTSFANAYLPAAAEGLVFVNADEIAREIVYLNLPSGTLDFRAGRLMLQRIDAAVDGRQELMLETTLASLTYARKIPKWQQAGYSVALIYLRLANVDQSIERVRRRVEAGGHDIPERTIRTRFGKSLDYLERIYKPIVDEWYIWGQSGSRFRACGGMGRSMTKRLDVEKVRSALKSAAKNAVSGPRELRSGRLVSRDVGSGRFVERGANRGAKDRAVVEKGPKS